MNVMNPSNTAWLPKCALVIGLFTILYVPFVAKPVHIDDANVLMLAEGAARDPWRPHSIEINWWGGTQPAFEAIANPPGIAWYLAPVRNCPEWILHLCMLPWLALSAWGCWKLGQEFTDHNGFTAAVFLLTCPVVVVSAHALKADLPLFACMASGVGGFISTNRRRWPFALLAGCAALFKYSGGVAIPLLILIGWRRGGSRLATVAAISALPILALALHDLHAYGRIHLLEMFADQNDPKARPFTVAIENCVGGLAVLGGTVVLPVLVWRSEAVIGAVLGAVAGLNAAFFSELTIGQSIGTALFTAAGGAAISLTVAPRIREPILSTWALGGAFFFFLVRFAAARYWMAFLPGTGLLALRNAERRAGLLTAGIVANVIVSLGIAIDDQNLAQAHKQAALRVAELGTGSFSGHWGWQYYLEKAGWKPLEIYGEPAALHASLNGPDAQPPDKSVHLALIEQFEVQDDWWGPRVYSADHRAFYHGRIYRSYAPWTFSDEPYAVVSVFKRVDGDAGDEN